MFVAVWFIVVAIGLLIAVSLHSCDEDRTGRNRARMAEWSRRQAYRRVVPQPKKPNMTLVGNAVWWLKDLS